MRKFALCLTLPLLVGFGPPAVDTNNNGVEKYKEERYSDAFKDFAKALGKDPFNPIFRFNLGESFYSVGEHEKALKQHESVGDDPKVDPELRFQSLFNAGNIALEKKDVAKALEYYQKALEIKPDSLETKTNIELAFKQGGGGGGGGKDQQKQQQNKKGDQQNQGDGKKDQKGGGQKDSQKKKKGPRPTPQPFKSKELTQRDVRQILEELKRQEEAIRSKQDKKNQKSRERNIEKDW